MGSEETGKSRFNYYKRYVRQGLAKVIDEQYYTSESFKMGLYLLIPIGFVVYFQDALRVRDLLMRRQPIVYPREQARPPTGSLEEIQEAMRSRKSLKE